MNTETYRYVILRFFDFEHLPPHLQVASKPFHDLAYMLAEFLPMSAETSTALRKLLEAKDCAVRALLEPKILKDEADD